MFVEIDKTSHERHSFDSGESELNAFLKTKAVKHLKAGISRTMVLEGDRLESGKCAIKAFYSIAPSSIACESLPEKDRKRLPKYPVPVLLIAQLAVNKANQGEGLGELTLMAALRHLWQINKELRAFAVTVDCLNENAQRFYKKYGFARLEPNGGKVSLFLPLSKVNLLFSH